MGSGRFEEVSILRQMSQWNLSNTLTEKNFHPNLIRSKALLDWHPILIKALDSAGNFKGDGLLQPGKAVSEA